MSARNTERLNRPEDFPDINRGGNLVFCARADEAKLVNILSAGITPRRGAIKPASYFPDVVSFAATAFSLDASVSHIWTPLAFSALCRGEQFSSEGFRYALVIDPKFVEGNPEQFLFVGETLVHDQINRLRVGPLSNVPIAEPIKPLAMFNEVHYLDGALSPHYIIGAAVAESKDDKFKRGIETVKSAVTRVRHLPGSQLPSQFALYNAQGQLFDIAA